MEMEGKSLIQLNAKESWVLIQRQCEAFLKSGFLPVHIKTISQAVTIAWKGHELGVPPLQAFSSIGVINGKPCLSAELMLALIYQRVKGAKVTFRTAPEKQNEECTVEMQRPYGEPQAFRFTMEDAKVAGILRPNSPWQKYPAAMLRARAISAGARAVFPDAIMGCYTPEEMGADPIDIEPLEVEVSSPSKREQQESQRPGQVETIGVADTAPSIASAAGLPNSDDDEPITFGKYKGKRISEIRRPDLMNYINWMETTARQKNKPMDQWQTKFIQRAEKILSQELRSEGGA